MDSCQGLWVGLGGCPPRVGGSHLDQSCFPWFFPLWAQVLTPAPGVGVGDRHGLGCPFVESVSLVVAGEQGAGDPGGTVSRKLSG